MPNCTWTIRWTPDGVITQRIIDGEIVAESREATIEGALAGLAIALRAEEEAYEFPKAGYPTQAHIAAEKLARCIESSIHQLHPDDGT